MARSGNRPGKQSSLRIIGGQWRGRKLAFTPAEGLRPTPDRVRETLFNWLAPRIAGAHCLDLFAGSGALGLEALSRGAASCDFADTSVAALRQIGQHLQTLDAVGRGRCHQTEALQFLRRDHPPWDIVFLDPPFGQDLADPAMALLVARGLLAGDGLIYVETSVRDPLPTVPDGWQLFRDKTAGDVAYRLYRQGSEPPG